MSERLVVAGVTITPPAYKASGGVSAGIDLMKRVAERVDCHMLVMADRDEEARDGSLPIHRIKATNILGPTRPNVGPLRSLHTLGWRADFGPWLDRLKPDIIHLHNPHPPGALARAAKQARRRGIPYVVSTHGFVEFEDYTTAYGVAAWQRPLIDQIVRRPLVAVSRGAARVAMLSPDEAPLMTRMGVAEDRLEVVTNGVDPFFVDPMPPTDCDRLVSRFNLPTDRPLIFFVGNHTANKGIDTLLAASLMMQAPATVVVGGAIRSEAEHHAMMARANYDPTSRRVVFTDFLSREELKALYQRCDVFAFPSRADTLPLVLIEAMVSRLPVVSTRIGGIPYQVTDETGILIDPGDAAALAVALDALALDPARRAAMGEAGRKRALETFNWDRSADRAVGIYRDILAKRFPE